MKKARDTKMMSRSSSRAPEARNGSDSSKVKNKKAKDTEKFSKPSSASGAKADDDKHREKEQYTKSRAVPIFRTYSLYQASLSRATKQLMPTQRGRRPFVIIHFASISFPASFAITSTK